MKKFGELYERFCWYVSYTTGLLQSAVWAIAFYEIWNNFSLIDAYISNYLILENIKFSILFSRFKSA